LANGNNNPTGKGTPTSTGNTTPSSAASGQSQPTQINNKVFYTKQEFAPVGKQVQTANLKLDSKSLAAFTELIERNLIDPENLKQTQALVDLLAKRQKSGKALFGDGEVVDLVKTWTNNTKAIEGYEKRLQFIDTLTEANLARSKIFFLCENSLK
jgi:hypothetical protein